MQNTPNYGLKKPEQSDFYNVDDFNANTDIIDAEIANVNADISNLETNKLDKTGDASNVTNTFTQASTRANLVSGENQSAIFGKLMKWFADLKPVAWSGNASDLTEDASNRFVTDAEKTTWNGKLDKSGGEITGELIIQGNGRVKVRGTGTGDGTYSYIGFYENDIETRRGFVGDGGGDGTFAVYSDIGDLKLVAPAGKKVLVNNNEIYHQGNDGAGSGLDADLLQGQDLGQITHTKNIYSPTAGILVDFGDLADERSRFFIEIKGGSNSDRTPIHTELQFFHDTSVGIGTFYSFYQHNIGYGVGTCQLMLVDGVMKVWIPTEKPYWWINVSVRNNDNDVTEYITLTSAPEPVTLPRKKTKKLGVEPRVVTNKIPFTVTNTVKDTGGTMAGSLDMGGNSINNVSGLALTDGYLTMQSFDDATYGVGLTQLWYNPNNQTLNVYGKDEANVATPVRIAAGGGFNPQGATIINLGDGVNATDAVNKRQLDMSKSLLNEVMIGYDDTIHETTPVQDILKDLFVKSQAVVGTDKPFGLTFAIRDEPGFPRNFTRAIQSLIEEKYGISIGMVTLEFKIEASTTVNGTDINYSGLNKCSIWNSNFYFEWEFDYDNWHNVIVRDAKGNVHADLFCETKAYMFEGQNMNIDVPYRNYISGITVVVSDYDQPNSEYTTHDTVVRYIPRMRPNVIPPGLSYGDGDTLFAYKHTITSSAFGSDSSPDSLANIFNITFEFHYSNEQNQFPNGINLLGLLSSTNNDVVLSNIVIHYGDKDWTLVNNQLETVQKVEYVLFANNGLVNDDLTIEQLPESIFDDRIDNINSTKKDS